MNVDNAANTGRASQQSLNDISRGIISGAMRVHSILGPGLLERAYTVCLAAELQRRGLRVRTEVLMPVCYEGVTVDVAYRIDLLVEEAVLVESKARAAILPVHESQLLSYLKLGGFRLGLLINFHSVHLRDGIRRLVNGL